MVSAVKGRTVSTRPLPRARQVRALVVRVNGRWIAPERLNGLLVAQALRKKLINLLADLVAASGLVEQRSAVCDLIERLLNWFR